MPKTLKANSLRYAFNMSRGKRKSSPGLPLSSSPRSSKRLPKHLKESLASEGAQIVEELSTREFRHTDDFLSDLEAFLGRVQYHSQEENYQEVEHLLRRIDEYKEWLEASEYCRSKTSMIIKLGNIYGLFNNFLRHKDNEVLQQESLHYLNNNGDFSFSWLHWRFSMDRATIEAKKYSDEQLRKKLAQKSKSWYEIQALAKEGRERKIHTSLSDDQLLSIAALEEESSSLDGPWHSLFLGEIKKRGLSS